MFLILNILLYQQQQFLGYYMYLHVPLLIKDRHPLDQIGIKNPIKKNQLHTVSRIQQGRQRDPSVKTLRSLFPSPGGIVLH